MSEMLAAVVILPSLGLAVLVFGFAPGFVNRLFAHIYPKGDARRREVIAELYAVPRWEQPFWVAQQAERAISEGIPARLRNRRALSKTYEARIESRTGVVRFTVTARGHVSKIVVEEGTPNIPSGSDLTELAKVLWRAEARRAAESVE